MKATLLVDEQLSLQGGKYRAMVRVYKVAPNQKFPDGIKARFVLVDTEREVPCLVVDNHEPFGFHMHRSLPDKKMSREPIQAMDYKEAKKKFFTEVRRIIGEDQDA